MIDWESGCYSPRADAWRYLDDDDDVDVEVFVPGHIGEPNEHWLRIARETMNDMHRHHAAAKQSMDRFIDRSRITAHAQWEVDSIVFGSSAGANTVRMVIYYRIEGDEYALWSVAFQATGCPAPNDLHPVSFSRQTQ